MGWIDYKKAYDMVPHSGILEMFGLERYAENVEGLLKKSMTDWKTVSNGDELVEVAIKWGFFHGDLLSPLLFIIEMIPLTMLLKREDLRYKWGPDGTLINHLLFMDDSKLYGKSVRELDGLV